jgi:hypothetical protein
VCYQTRNGRLCVRTAFFNGRRTLPPIATSDWGRSMRAKKGGYARQRQCRALGIHPTAPATTARLARRAVATTAGAQASAPVQPTVAQTCGGNGSGTNRLRSGFDVTCRGERGLSEALAQTRPIGRAERIASLQQSSTVRLVSVAHAAES